MASFYLNTGVHMRNIVNIVNLMEKKINKKRTKKLKPYNVKYTFDIFICLSFVQRRLFLAFLKVFSHDTTCKCLLFGIFCFIFFRIT